MDLTSTLGVLTLALQLASVPPAQQQSISQVRVPASISIEAESLMDLKPTQGRAAPQDMRGFGSGWSGDAQLFWGGPQPGAELNLGFTSTATGRFQVFLHFTCAPDYAVVQASFDGAPWVSFNGYATTVTRDRALLTMRDLTPGRHEVLLKVQRKEGQSRGYNVGVDRIELEPVSASGPAGGSGTRSRGVGEIGSLTKAVGASMVEGGTPSVPVLQITTAAAPLEETMGPGVAPLAMSMRLSVTEQATSLHLQNAGEPLRLSPSTPRILKKAAMQLIGGSFTSTLSGDGSMRVQSDGMLSLSYVEMEPKQPLLLDCGVLLYEPAEISVSMLISPKTNQVVKVSLPKGEQRLMAVLIPTYPIFTLYVKASTKSGFSAGYCELTPFKQ